MLKRVFDLTFGILSAILFLPLAFVIAILIFVEDPGPVLFKQERIGRFGARFTIFKFRSMYDAANKKLTVFEPGNLSRITRVGKYIRKWKLDELPQLINVIRGDMSIVGPRPEVPEWVNVYPEHWKIIHQVKPGITDMASIYFRNEEKILSQADNPKEAYRNIILPAKLHYYENYVKKNSVKGDLIIILETLKAIIM